MKNTDLWKPSKFTMRGNTLTASPDPSEVGVGSRIVTDRVAIAYQNALREHARGVLVDVGCGRVPLYGVYRDLVTEAICVDWGNSAHDTPHLDHEADISLGLPFLDDARVDTVLATDVIEHLAEPRTFFREAVRVLRPGGKLILGVPFLYRIHEAPHDHYRYTRFRLEGFCAESGLSVVTLRPYAGPLAVILDIAGKNIPGGRARAAFQAFGGWLLRSRLGQRIDERNREIFPMGYCLVAERARDESRPGER